MDEKKKRLYMVIIFVILLLIGFLVKFTILDDDKNLEEPNKQEEIEAEKNENEVEDNTDEEDTVIIKNDNYNYEVDESLRVNIPNEVMQYVPKENFVNMMKDFLSENQLMTKGTAINNDGTVTINYPAKEVTFVVIVNNSQQTSITVVVKDKTEISFLY